MPHLRFHCEICDTAHPTCDGAAKCERAHEVKAFAAVVAVRGNNTRPITRTRHLLRAGARATLCGMLKFKSSWREPDADEKTMLCPSCDVCRLAAPPADVKKN